MSKETMTMSTPRRSPPPLVLRCARALAAPRRRRQARRSPHSTSARSDTPGRRPPRPRSTTLHARRTGSNPRRPRTSTFNLPEGVFGNPSAIFKCRAADFALNQCPPDSQVGLITVNANYEGDPNYLLGTAPIYNMEPGQRRRDGALRLRRADAQHPDLDPGRGAHRLRLRPALHRPEHHPADRR